MANKLTGITAASNITSVLTDVDLIAYSKDIQYQAQPDLYWEQLAEKRTELGVQPGKTIQFLRVNDVPEGDELTEGKRMETDDLSTNHMQIQVVEWGKAIALTEFLLRTSAYELMESIVKVMSDNYAKTSNLMFVRTLFQNVANIMYGNDRPSRAQMIPGVDIMSVDVLKEITEDKEIRLVPAIKSNPALSLGANYVMLSHPHSLRQLKNDTEFIRAKHYGAPRDLFTGEIGMIDNVRILRTTFIPVIKHPGTYIPYGDDTPVTPPANIGHVFINGKNMTDLKPLMFPAQTIVPGSPPIYQSMVLGDRAYALAESLAVGLRTNGIIDFERERNVAWYAIRGAGMLLGDHAFMHEHF